MPSLRLQAPGHPATVYHLYKKITSIGSGPDNDIVLPDPLVADAFASVHFDGQTYTIATLHRKLDVVVNGKKRSKHVLRHEDRLMIGSCELRFSLVMANPRSFPDLTNGSNGAMSSTIASTRPPITSVIAAAPPL